MGGIKGSRSREEEGENASEPRIERSQQNIEKTEPEIAKSGRSLPVVRLRSSPA